MTQPVPEMMTLLLEIGEQSSQLWLSQPEAAPSHYPLAFGTPRHPARTVSPRAAHPARTGAGHHGGGG